MPRYLIERRFTGGIHMLIDEAGAKAAVDVIAHNAEQGVTWIQSFITPDRKRSFCIYDAPSLDAIRVSAERNSLPVDTITEVRVLDPYFYY